MLNLLLSPFRGAAAAESLQMACAASELAIADTEPLIISLALGQLRERVYLERRQMEGCTGFVP